MPSQVQLDPSKARRVTTLDPARVTPVNPMPSMVPNRTPKDPDRFTVPTVVGNLPVSREVSEQFGRNIVSSTGRIVKDFGSALAHPLRTGGTVLDLLAGTADKLFPGNSANQEPAQKVDALLDYYADRFGGKDQIMNTLYNDPAGFAADIAMMAGAGGGLMRATGRLAGAPGLMRTGERAVAAANAIDPVYQMGRVAAETAGGLMRTTGRAASETIGVTTGAGGEAVRTGVMAPSDAVDDFRRAMRGQIDDLQIVRDARDALNEIRVDRGARYAERAADVFADAPDIDLRPIRDQAAATLRSRHIRYAFTPDGQLSVDFAQSPITEAADQERIVKAVNDLNDWTSDPSRRTAEAVDGLKQRLTSYRMAAQTPRARGVIADMETAVRSSLNETVPGYRAMTREYQTLSEMIDMIDSELSLGPNKNPGTAVRKLSSALSQRSPYRQMLIDALDNYTGSNLREEIAGRAMSDWAPQGLMSPTRGLPTVAGIGAAGYVSLPLGGAAAAASSPRAMGELLLALGMVRRGVLRPLRTGIGRGLETGTRAFLYNPAVVAGRVSPGEEMISNTGAALQGGAQ